MDTRALTRRLLFGALVTGFVPLSSVDAAAAESPAALCSSTFGEEGPQAGPVVGEGPPGDPMPVTVAWSPPEWPEGLRHVLTCVSVDGRAVPSLAAVQEVPPNSGMLNFDLRLPAARTGAVVCQQGVLVGSGGRRQPTRHHCFKVRAADPPAVPSADPTTGDAPDLAAASTPPARRAAARPLPAETDPPAPTPGSESAAGGTPSELSRAADTTEPGMPRPTLARTGAGDRIPLAAAGSLLALGGAAIVLGEPRRRARPAPR